MATDTLTEEFRSFLEGCTQEMASQIISTLQQAGRDTESSTASGMKGSAVAKTSKRQRKKQKAEVALALHGPVGPLRPLNSWMAFRKFYNGMLSPRTQKAISKLLMLLWRADPFKAKWAILAKAYSILRGDREKKDVPLDAFFAICAPLIGVIPPEEYLQTMGWQLISPQDGDDENMPQIARLFTPDLDAFPEEFTTTTLSVDDLVNHCYAVGYADSNSNGSPNASTQGSLTMVSKPTAITTNDEGEATQMAPSAQTNTDPVFAGPPAGVAILDQSLLGLIEEAGAENPYGMTSDPTSQLTLDFNPVDSNNAVEDGGRWDAYDPPASVPPPSGEQDFSFSELVNASWDEYVGL